MSSSRDVDVLVVGAGPVGLVLANELARFGIKFRIVDKLSTRSTWSKALMITSRSMAILENMGLHEEILQQGTVAEGVDFYFNQKPMGSLSMGVNADQTIRYPYPFILQQPSIEEAFEHVLNKRGFVVERGTEVIDLKLLKDHVEVTLKTGEVIHATYVVGCDGAHSFIRHSQKEWTFEGRPVNMLFAQCDGTIADTRVAPTRGTFYAGKTGFTIILPLFHYQRRFRVIVNVPPKTLSLDMTGEFRYGRLDHRQPSLEEFNCLVKAAMGSAYVQVTEPTWLTYFMVQERMVTDLRAAGRLFLAGDAAHCHSPAGGQGMNMGIQDAHNIAWKLALVIKGQTSDPEKLLDSYSTERIPIIAKTISLTATLLRGADAATSWWSWLIYLILSTAISFQSVQKEAISRFLQSRLTVTPTPDGILSTCSTKMVKPGMMLPDTPHPIFCLTAFPPDVTGTTHVMSVLRNSYKHLVLFIIADHALYESHPLFQKFATMCKSFRSNLRPAILARAHRIGGFRRPDWSDDNIVFFGCNHGITEKAFGLNGKEEMGLLIIRPDGYIAFSTPIDSNGNNLDIVDQWLQTFLVKSKRDGD